MYKIKYLVFVLLMIFMSGCFDDTHSKVLNEPNGFKTICIDGVTYIKFKSNDTLSYKGFYGLTVKFNKHSKIIPCSN